MKNLRPKLGWHAGLITSAILALFSTKGLTDTQVYFSETQSKYRNIQGSIRNCTATVKHTSLTEAFSSSMNLSSNPEIRLTGEIGAKYGFMSGSIGADIKKEYEVKFGRSYFTQFVSDDTVPIWTEHLYNGRVVETWQYGEAVVDGTSVPFEFLNQVSVDNIRHTRKDCCAGRVIPVSEQQITTGQGNARVTKSDSELHTDDWTGIDVSYNAYFSSDRRKLLLRLTWKAIELNKHQNRQGTEITSTRDIKIFDVANIGDGCLSARIDYFEGLTNVQNDYQLLRGKIHGFHGIRPVGDLYNISVEIDGKGKNDDRRQKFVGQLSSFRVVLRD